MGLGLSAPARAEAPKAPEAKAPKAPEAKLPEGKLPEGKLPEPKFPTFEAPETGGFGIPEQLAGGEGAGSQMAVEEIEDSKALTIEDISNTKVRTASNRPEDSRDAPAYIITITSEEMKSRGYQELTDILDDLPGMDVVRGWGDTYFKNYWRGYRNNIGDPFLLLVDGVSFNHLWLGEAQVMAALPLSNIEQVEVVYGPASALYGPNASMGVINVITRKDIPGKLSTGVWSQISMRSPQGSLGRVGDMTKVGDVSALYKGQGFRVSVTGRFDFGILDPALGERFEWLKDVYSTDRDLWGDFVDYPAIAGSFRSPNEKQSVDARFIVERRNDEAVLTGTTEVAAQMYRMVNGSGLIYPTDRFQPRSLWTVLEQSLSLRHQEELSSALTSTTLLRYRRSNVDSPTTVVGRDTDSGLVSFAYRLSNNNSISVSQGFNLNAGSGLVLKGDALQFDFGLQYERRDLDKDTLESGNDWDPSEPFIDSQGEQQYEFPQPVEAKDSLQNRSQLDVMGFYLLSRYKFLTNHSVNAGLRLDYNSIFDQVVPTFRGGYVGHFLRNDLTVKLFYGQAVEEPGWQYLSGSLGAPEEGLVNDPERSQTGELGADYKLTNWLVLHGTAYYVAFHGTIAEGLEGERRMAGADLGATALVHASGIRQLRLWAYYSPYLYLKQSSQEDGSVLLDTGDLARHKLLLGATLDVNRSFGVTALGRCISEREPVISNPLGTVPGYCVVDANVRLKDVFADGLTVAFRVTNLLDTQYSHPGLYDADSGNTPGRWEDGQWIGSAGYSNSQMPQPGRAFTLQLGLDL